MTKYKIINLFDRLFITVSIFLIIYAWINFYIRDLWTTFFLSLFFTFGCTFLIFYLLGRKHEKKSVSKQYQKEIEEKFLAFRLMSKNEKLILLKSIIEKHSDCQLKKESLITTSNEKKHQIMLATHVEKLTQFEVVNLMENLEKNIDVLKIICCDVDLNFNANIIKNLEVEIITKKKLYDEFFVANNSFPDSSNLTQKTKQKKFMEIMKNFFIPSKSKSYFLCGLILIFSSIILPYHTYYLIVGTILLLFGIICKLQPYTNS